MAGQLLILPWLRLPVPVMIGRFRFVPTAIADIVAVVGPGIASEAAAAARTHVDLHGKPIEACTVVVRPRARSPWDLPETMLEEAFEAAELLALACLSNQRFFQGHFAPHMNAAMFRPVGFRLTANSDALSLSYQRRGGSLGIGGLRFKGVVFQRPPQVEATECGEVDLALVKAILVARSTGGDGWQQIRSSLQPFLLAHAEQPDLAWEHCVLLSTMAFERLLRCDGKAAAFAEAFASVWSNAGKITIKRSKRIKPDPSWADAQANWPLHRKWAKELYEARNSAVHNGPNGTRSVHWSDWQHVVIAAVAFPLTVKLILAQQGLRALTDDDSAIISVFDELLESDMRGDVFAPPAWPRIIDEARSSYQLSRIIRRAIDKASKKVVL